MPNFIKQIFIGSDRQAEDREDAIHRDAPRSDSGTPVAHERSRELEPTVEIPRPVFDKPFSSRKAHSLPEKPSLSLRLDDPTVEIRVPG